jgi:hypothetical protein
MLVRQSEFVENGTTMHLRSEYSDSKDHSTRIERLVQVGDSPPQLLWKSYAVKNNFANYLATRSKIPAAPMPPPTHMVTRP